MGQVFTSETTFSLRSVVCFQRLKHQGEEVDDDMEDEFYLKRLDSGLFTLQLIDYIMLEVCASGASSVSFINSRVYSNLDSWNDAEANVENKLRFESVRGWTLSNCPIFNLAAFTSKHVKGQKECYCDKT